MVWGVSPRTAPGLDGRGEEWKTHAVVLVPGRSTQGGMQLAKRTPRVAATMDEQPETAPSCTANTPATEPRQANEQAKSDRPERTQCKWNARHRGPYSTHPSWQAQSGAEGEQSLKPAAPSKTPVPIRPARKGNHTTPASVAANSTGTVEPSTGPCPAESHWSQHWPISPPLLRICLLSHHATSHALSKLSPIPRPIEPCSDHTKPNREV